MAAPGRVGYYDALDFNSPLTDASAERLVAGLAEAAPSTVLDIGCGWAELLLRLLARCPTASGHGIDRDEVLLERARTNAGARGLSDRVTFGPTATGAEPADLVICVGAEHVFGTLDEALPELHALVHPGGRLLLGTLFWEWPPTPGLVEDFGELPDLVGLTGIVVPAGFRPLGLTVATARDWDRFEFGYLSDWEHAVMTATDPADADEARRSADTHRDGYLERRGVLGFAYLTLGRPVG